MDDLYDARTAGVILPFARATRIPRQPTDYLSMAKVSRRARGARLNGLALKKPVMFDAAMSRRNAMLIVTYITKSRSAGP